MKKTVVGIYRGTRKNDNQPFVALHTLEPASFNGFEGEKTEILYVSPEKVPQGLKPRTEIEVFYNISGNKAYLDSISICK